MKSGGGDEDVRVADQLALATKLSANPGEALQDETVQREDAHYPQKSAEAGLMGLRIASVVDPLVDLAKRDQTDRQALRGKQVKKLVGLRPPLQVSGHVVGIDEVLHSST